MVPPWVGVEVELTELHLLNTGNQNRKEGGGAVALGIRIGRKGEGLQQCELGGRGRGCSIGNGVGWGRCLLHFA